MHGLATNFVYFFVYFASVFSKNDQIFTVYRLIPRTRVQLEFLRNLFHKDYELELDFWIEPSKNGRPVDIMVGQKVQSTFLEKLTANGLNFTIRVNDVEKLIKEREHKKWRKTVLRDDSTNRDANNAGRYDIFRYKSYDELVTEYYINHNITNYVDKFTWYIVPNLNPDGYEYSRSSTNPQVRGWRKNRSLRTGCTHERCCSGVNYGSSENRCSHVYHGETAFSELETQAVRNFVKIHRQEMDAFITLHAHSQFWAFPYGYLTGYYPRDVKDLVCTCMFYRYSNLQ
uniref:Zinc carboxypeptidase A 1 n=1 Tax=Romanomermis culicivorax TaxID=13658 RepID=A0A915I1Q9_ROMCU